MVLKKGEKEMPFEKIGNCFYMTARRLVQVDARMERLMIEEVHLTEPVVKRLDINEAHDRLGHIKENLL
jgi:septation ring formation regulator EzrA